MQKIIYIGDISKQDAKIIMDYSIVSKNILEFGSGASTQLFASHSDGNIISVDTSNKWIKVARNNLKELGIKKEVSFCHYSNLKNILKNKKFDLIFNDGKQEYRKDFADKTWKFLKVNGFYLFHDTRRQTYVNNIIDLMKDNFLEIEYIKFNVDDSNITIVKKCEKKEYVNWNKVEKKENWMVNEQNNKPFDWKEKLIKQLNE